MANVLRWLISLVKWVVIACLFVDDVYIDVYGEIQKLNQSNKMKIIIP